MSVPRHTLTRPCSSLVAGAGLSVDVILILGFSSIFADAVSMGAGDAMSTKAENDYILAEKKREEWCVSLLSGCRVCQPGTHVCVTSRLARAGSSTTRPRARSRKWLTCMSARACLARTRKW